MGIKLCISGSRAIRDYPILLKAIEYAKIIPEDIDEIVEGGAQGVDKLAQRYAKENNLKLVTMNAEWSNLDAKPCVVGENLYGKYNKLAGHNRNRKMIEYADMVLAIWDGVSHGTLNAIETAKEIGKEIIIYEI